MNHYIVAAFKQSNGGLGEFSSVCGSTKNLKKLEKLCAELNKEEGHYRVYKIQSYANAA